MAKLNPMRGKWITDAKKVNGGHNPGGWVGIHHTERQAGSWALKSRKRGKLYQSEDGGRTWDKGKHSWQNGGGLTGKGAAAIGAGAAASGAAGATAYNKKIKKNALSAFGIEH